ncbi:lytic polysaccharide monooxygenase auxiliary activity family 9 protein [Actinoalloteichus hymeniacidonis]|uniref:CBM2 domain-containing protein n=1 Tax=Actinoalloteichus hymeniacidonis TaxID=340345 RepID=A0AAC9HPM3_9PSEU|nr:lytic polysaccharide monooxygenase [Actinoalloteichus hymeniacidonis]AOS63069.1 hypothetical protein TL08_11275 [Actinoalloteichus hymeniacidonis]MBB5908895.1 chitin-binding protein [Actinoalloteichus hymeniacidonis]
MRTRHKVGFWGALAALVGALVVVTPAEEALAHGGLTYPATRTYACYVNGLEGGQGGDVNPTNPACAAAVAQGGKNALWNWFGNLISDAGGRHREIIPDGNLCGPSDTFSGFNLARSDWPTTQLQAGANITFRYNAWAPHPGTWSQYITKDGWDPNQPLRWSDLESVPFDEVTNPPIDGSGPHGAEYTWRGQLPSGKSGKHLIYSIWQRSDSAEAFYNCSDVVFSDSGDPGEPEPPEPEPIAIDCAVEYTKQSEWNNGFVAEVVLRNTGSAAISGWGLTWPYSDGQQVTNAWGASVAQQGAEVTVRSNSGTGHIPVGGSVTFGFQGTHGGSNSVPATFAVNDTLCS